MRPSRDHAFAQLPVGARATVEYPVTAELYHGFLALFGDHSPVHVDEAYARAAGFAGRVMHGAMLHGFLSHFVGMELPGRRALLLSVDLRYARPFYLGEVIALTGEVTQVVESRRVVVLDLSFVERASGRAVARGRAQVLVRDA